VNVDEDLVVSPAEMARIRALDAARASRFQELPPTLEGAARRVLEGRRAVKIARTAAEGDAGALARFAEEQRQRKRARAKARRAIEKRTRRAQRGRRK
jgi:hypothetical protein